MRIIKYIIIGFITIFVALVTVNLFAPTKLKVSKSIVINGSPERIYASISDFETWNRWDPIRMNDTSFSETISQPSNVIGASRSWTSSQSGNGEESILALRPNEYMKTGFPTGDTVSNIAEWEFEVFDKGVKVFWVFTGSDLPFLMRFSNLMLGPMIEDRFDEGLLSLKQYVESSESEDQSSQAE